jgi:hypothetical protein
MPKMTAAWPPASSLASSSLLRMTPKLTRTSWRHVHFHDTCRSRRRCRRGRLPACSPAPMNGAKGDDGGVKAATCSPVATSSTLDDDVGAGAAGMKPCAHGRGQRRR